MVTGVETAGLVLAAIPLIICALENYESTIGPTKAFIQWKGNLSKAKNELYVLHAAYDQTLRVLLNPVTSKEDLETMVGNIKSDLWTQGDVAEDLENHLGKAYMAVITEIEQIGNNLLEIVKHLNIAGTQQPSQQSLQSIVQANPPASSSLDPRKRFFFRERVRFTMKRQNLRERMDRLHKSIETLAGFAERAEKLHDESPRQRCKVKFSAPLKSIRENACKMHRVLLSCWCTSHAPHRAGILLEERMVRRKRGRQPARDTSESIGTADRFALCLDEHLPTEKWLATEFRIVELSKGTTSTVAIKVTSSTPQDDDTPYSDPSQLHEVAEICSYLQQRNDHLVGFCLDDSHKLRAYRGNFSQVHHVPQGVTLAQILPQLPRKLANGDVYRLAIALTASVLQLIETPWLDGGWNKSAIMFTRISSNVAGNVDIKYPLLLTDFSPGAHHAPSTNTLPAMRERTILLSLGIMLLEISSGRSIESFRIPQDLGTSETPNNDSDLITAHRWLIDQEMQGNLSYGFVTAITSCLQAYLNPRARSSDPEFCQHIQETVIKPLEVEMQCLLYGL